MSRRLIGVVGAAAIAVLPVAAAAQAPTVNWGSFTKEADVATCASFAEAVLRKEHLRVLNRSGSVLLAGNNSVVAEIACYPSGNSSRVVVAAFSTDPQIAERTRSDLRATIERIVCTGPRCQ